MFTYGVVFAIVLVALMASAGWAESRSQSKEK